MINLFYHAFFVSRETYSYSFNKNFIIVSRETYFIKEYDLVSRETFIKLINPNSPILF